MAVILDIADAVVTELNSTEWSQEFTAERRYRPELKLADLATLHVLVVPRSVESSTATRSGYQHDYKVDVGVLQRFSEAESEEIDDLMDLVEEIADHFAGLRLDSPDAICVATANEPVYAQEHMAQWRQFTSVLTLTFRLWR